MKNYHRVLLLIFITSNILYSQYEVRSKYLLDPNLNIGFVDSCAAFWLNSYDNLLGGFYTNVDREGNVVSAWGTNKNMLTQSRNAYGMVRAFMLTGDEEYLEKAEGALDFMYKSAWDESNGGWFGEIGENGSPLNSTGNKTAFDQHYALLGILAFYEATGDTNALNWFEMGFQNNSMKLWDNDSDLFGYYDYGSYNWNQISGKSFNATVDAVTTHLLNAYLLKKDDVYKEYLLEVADNIVNRLVPTMDLYEIGFVESFNTDWTWSDNTNNYNTRTIMGHVLKAGWVLGRIHQIIPDDNYLQSAEKLVTHVYEKGYDHKYGGPFKDYDRLTGEMYFYGQDTAKAWWQIEQAIVAGLTLYHLTNNEIYLEMADESLNFFMKYFVDRTYGEIFADLFMDGSLIPSWGTTKGNGWKAGYHSIETGYYAYLYGNLFFRNSPVELFYKFSPVNYDREILLSPLAINNPLIISEVLKNNENYSEYSASERLLFISAGNSGIFKVRFEIDIPFSVAENNQIETNFLLDQNYPNPFNPETTIRYTIGRKLQGGERTTLKVFDILGQEVMTLVDRIQSPGIYEVKLDGSKLNSGIYFYTLKAGSFMETKKMILLK